MGICHPGKYVRSRTAVCGNLQNATPIETEDKHGETTAEEGKSNPVKVEEEVPRKLLAVKHTEGGWVYERP